MSERPQNTNPTRDISAREVLGLSGSAGEDWARLRALQFDSAGQTTHFRLLSHAIAAFAVLWLYRSATNIYAISAWMVILAATLLYCRKTDSLLNRGERRRINRDDFWRQTAGGFILALVWTTPVVFLVQHGSPDARLELWTIQALLLMISAVVIPSVPLATLIFAVIVGGANVASLYLGGNVIMAMIAALFNAAIFFGTIETSRNFLLSRLAEAGVAESKEVVSLLLREYEEGDADWLWETDTKRRIRGVSRRFAFSLGMEPNEIDGQSLVQMIAGPSWETGHFHASLHDLVERMKRRELFSNLLVRVTVKGEQRWWELSGTPRFDESGAFAGFRGVGSDVTQQRESSDKIAYMARYDTLTGLPNRMMLTEASTEALRYSEQWRTRCAFLMIDLDRFKAVNDTLGHIVGDQLLACVSDRLKSLMSENELCGRLGGDEFAIVVRDASDIMRVNHVAQAVIDRLSEPYTVDNHVLYVGASVGSAIGPRDGSTVETLMRNADLALYQAKDEGGGAHCTYEPSMHAQADERRKLEFSLRHALERNELKLHFQPVVDAISETVLSFEALLRWQSPEHGMVSPVKFVPVAEDTRLIVPIGEWVLREACKEALNWPSHVKVAVNVSGEQLLDPNLIPSVVSALSIAGLPARRLEIEVTESIFVRDATTARVALEKIMALGCGVALDDFGTGYSSLGYLRKLHFTTIKVDRSFVQGAAQGSQESLAIIRAVVAMADSLEMSTTAEGVETEEELALIRQLGCKKIQGYYFGRPMTPEDASGLFRRGNMAGGMAG
ncbi:MAG: hypothetical protein RLY97_1008 [Pseudomonadota bacterium]|jgi:diguanylate cyclase (GGDEF)-like protein/PAS domain S-box-containing protein